MAFKNFFTGKSGFKFWANIILMVVIVMGVPVATLYMLDTFTHHGEKIEVPNVVGKLRYDAEYVLKERGLKVQVVDSVYNKRARPGAVLEQSPKEGYEVKGGRVVYLVLNLMGEPTADLPDVVGHGSLREAVGLLQSMGFKLTPSQTVMGQPKDLLIGVKQGGRKVSAGQTLSRERPLTLVVGGGVIDTLEVDEFDDLELDGEGEFEDEGGEEEGGDGTDFDIEL